MFLHRMSHKTPWLNAFDWFLLAFSAGIVNAGGFLATGRFVTHVTGFATLFGVDLERMQWDAAVGIISVPLFFLLGAFLAGWFIDRQIEHNRTPHFDFVMGGSAVCLFLAVFVGESDVISSFGQNLHLKNVYVLLALLCLSSGLQNAALTSSSGSSVRTSHLTGLTTDLGLGIARAFSRRIRDEKIASEIRTNFIRLGTIISFVAGSGVGAFVFSRMGFRGFVLPALISMYAAFHGRKAKFAVRQMQSIDP